MEWVHVGYHIRKWPAEGHLTTDATEWACEQELLKRAKAQLGPSSHIFQLIDAVSPSEVEALAEIVDYGKAAALVSFEVLRSVVDAYSSKTGWPYVENAWGRFRWTEIGVDVCDADGLFSILHMGQKQVPERKLFSDQELSEALVLTQIASILVPSHAPFVAMRLRMLDPSGADCAS